MCSLLFRDRAVECLVAARTRAITEAQAAIFGVEADRHHFLTVSRPFAGTPPAGRETACAFRRSRPAIGMLPPCPARIDSAGPTHALPLSITPIFVEIIREVFPSADDA